MDSDTRADTFKKPIDDEDNSTDDEDESHETKRKVSKLLNYYQLLNLQEGVDSNTDTYKYLHDNLFSNEDMIDMFVDHRHDVRLKKLNCLIIKSLQILKQNHYLHQGQYAETPSEDGYTEGRHVHFNTYI